MEWTDRLPVESSTCSPFSFRFRDWGLVEVVREHSQPLTWHGMQPSSSSLLLIVQRVPAWRQAWQGGTDAPLRDAEAEREVKPAADDLACRLPSSSRWKLSVRLTVGSGREGLGAMAIGAVR